MPSLSADTIEGLKRSAGSAALLLVVFTFLHLVNLASSGLRYGVLLDVVPPVLAQEDEMVTQPESGETEAARQELFVVQDPCTLVDVVCAGGEGVHTAPADITHHPLLVKVQEVVQGICAAHGYGVQCTKDLMAMAWKESRFQADVVGDQGRSHGWWQIQVKLHGVPVACTADLKCAGEWTLTHLEGHSYPRLRTYAIMRHNGSGKAAYNYAVSVKSIAERLETIIK